MNSAWRAFTPSSTSVVLTMSNTAPATAHASGLPPYVVPCTPTVNALATSFGREQRADREAAAQALRARQDVGHDALLHVREERAGAAHAALDLVEDQERVVLRAKPARRVQERRRAGRHAAFALHGLEDHGADLVAALANSCSSAATSLYGMCVMPAGLGPKPDRVLRLAAGGDREQRAAVERVDASRSRGISSRRS